MNTLNLAKVQFCFPQVKNSIKDKEKFARLLFTQLKKNGSIKYAGYLKDKDLYNNILWRIDDVGIKDYGPLDKTKQEHIKKIIFSTVLKCHKKLSLPLKPIFIFIFPWFPGAEDAVMFGGINAVAPYVGTMHLFLDPHKFTDESLKETIAHELNHLVFYYYNNTKAYTLLENMIIEGLAENFRENIIGGRPAPWSVAFTKERAESALRALKTSLNSKSSRLYNEVFFGSKKYKKWTGYSVGYWYVKNFLRKNSKLSWRKIMRMEVRNFLN